MHSQKMDEQKEEQERSERQGGYKEEREAYYWNKLERHSLLR